MKSLLNLSLFIVIVLISCSKKSDDITANSVQINGVQYPTVVIGSQTWTAVNYNGPGGVNYNNSANNDPVYGKLYTYTEAEAIALPPGWRLPTQSDFTTLLITMGAPPGSTYYSLQDTSIIKLLSKTTWTNVSGSNTTGFNAVATGFYFTGTFSNLGDMTNLLSSSEFPDGGHMSLQMYEPYGNELFTGLNSVIPNETDRGSIRFVKDN